MPLYMEMSQNINKTMRHLKFCYISIQNFKCLIVLFIYIYIYIYIYMYIYIYIYIYIYVYIYVKHS